MKTFDHFIGGKAVAPTTGVYFETENPYYGTPWARVARGNAEDVDKAVQAAHQAFEKSWRDTTAVERGHFLRRIGDAILQRADELAEAEVRDNGKSIGEMRNQMRNMAEWYYYYGGLADKMEGAVIPTENPGFLNYTRLEPLGVIGAVLPWNSPLRLLAWKLGPALAAGNTVVVKPSEYTSTSAVVFADCIRAAGLPDGVINVVTGFGAEVVKPLAEHPLVAKIAFTGGEIGGRLIYQSAAQDFKKVSLELGGKSANIVFADADMESAARGVVTGIFSSSGQTCLAGSRLLVERSVHDKVVARVIELSKRIRYGDPMDLATESGPVATRPHYEKILKCIAMGKAEGAHLAAGGNPAKIPGAEGGLFIEPTVFTGVNNQMRIAREEVFGPVLVAIPFNSEDEAVAIANDSPYGLAAGVWSRATARCHRVAHRLEAGTVWINAYRMTSQLSPFGGYKQSGIGREGGIEAMREYLQVKSVWVNLGDTFKSPVASIN